MCPTWLTAQATCFLQWTPKVHWWLSSHSLSTQATSSMSTSKKNIKRINKSKYPISRCKIKKCMCQQPVTARLRSRSIRKAIEVRKRRSNTSFSPNKVSILMAKTAIIRICSQHFSSLTQLRQPNKGTIKINTNQRELRKVFKYTHSLIQINL